MPPQAPADWDTGDQIRNHTLVPSIINNHATDGNMVFDSAGLSQLQRFALDPSSRNQILQENDWVDEEGQRPGTKANERSGSLSGYLIARHGTENPALDDTDIELLRKWFVEGMPCGQSVVR